MAASLKNFDPAFQGAGQKVGLEIWRLEESGPLALPKSEHRRLYSRHSYIILHTSSRSTGARNYDIHYWIGSECGQDEARSASLKAVELDAALGSRAVQYRELQGHESDKFLSYFKPCFIPLEGSVKDENDAATFLPSLYVCKGKRAVRVKQVTFSRSSLNHDDVFVLDTKSKIYQFNGASSNIQERATALDLVQYLKSNHDEGKCEVAVIEDGKLGAEVDSGEFWGFFGGFAPIGKKSSSEDDAPLETVPGKLYLITGTELTSFDGPLSKGILESNKCYLLDCGREIYVWVGRVTQLEDRKSACQVAEEYVVNQKRPKHTILIRIIQGSEPVPFRVNFDFWPCGSGASGSEEGKGKVASLIKQQGGATMKGTLKPTPVKTDVPPLLEENGKLEVWLINNNGKFPVPKEEIGKFYSQDCYLVLYTYFTGGDRKEDFFLCSWLGQHSKEEDKMTASQLNNSMAASMKGKPVQGRLVQGKEPPQFIALFPNMVILNGKMNIDGTRDGLDESNDSPMLIRICGTERHTCTAVQVDPIATSLNSATCFLLQSGTSIFHWHGNSATVEQQKVAAKFAEFLWPGLSLKAVKEGTEPSLFWNALGGKQSYGSQQGSQESSGDPHLYLCHFDAGSLKLTEVFNFTQDELLTEDTMILDGNKEVFVWVGNHSDSKLKQQSFDIGQKYLEHAAAYEGLSGDTPLYKVTEGNEPTFFTSYFSWDSAKALVQGNSFQKKLTILLGKPVASPGAEKPRGRLQNIHAAFNGKVQNGEKSNGTPKLSFPQRSSVRTALSSFTSSNGNKAAMKVSKTLIKSSSNQSSDKPREEPPAISTDGSSENPLSETTEKIDTQTTLEIESNGLGKEDPATPAQSVSEDNDEAKSSEAEATTEEDVSSSIYSYERLKTKSPNPVPGIDPRRREAYLSPEEFLEVFKMEKTKFYELPKWRQQRKKKELDLF